MYYIPIVTAEEGRYMKYLLQAFLCLVALSTLIWISQVFASENINQTYQKTQLIRDIHTEKVDTRIERLKKFLEMHNSPMADSASHFVEEADRLNFDWRLVAAISGNESYFGWYIPYNSFNGWGWAVWTGTSNGANFQNWEEGITVVSEGLKSDYIDLGLTSVEQIGQKYAADKEWSRKVNQYMEEIESFSVYEKDEPTLAFSL